MQPERLQPELAIDRGIRGAERAYRNAWVGHGEVDARGCGGANLIGSGDPGKRRRSLFTLHDSSPRGGSVIPGRSTLFLGPMAILFLIVLSDLVGFGFVIPLLPFYGLHFGGTPAE